MPATPLLVRDRATPARPPHTQASWCKVSEAAKADDLMSSPISCCTVESRASLARTWPNAATRATVSAAHSPKNIAQSADTSVETPSIPNMMTYGLRARSAEPSAVPAKPPSVAAASNPPSATLSFTPWKCSVLSRNARKNTVKPENARRVAFARIASATTGPTWRSVRSPGRGDGRARPPAGALPAAAPPGTAPPAAVERVHMIGHPETQRGSGDVDHGGNAQDPGRAVGPAPGHILDAQSGKPGHAGGDQRGHAGARVRRDQGDLPGQQPRRDGGPGHR